MGAFQAETAATIAQRMINRIVARTKLTDITRTSEFTQVIWACARALEKTQQGMEDLLDDTDLDKATGQMLDAIAAKFNTALISRLAGAYATSSVVFSRAGTTGTVTIPVGTQVKAPSATGGLDLVYSTTAAGTIPNGSTTSAQVPIRAAEMGTGYRVTAGAITGFATKPSGVDVVTNTYSITNGLNAETDDEFRRRIKAYVKSLARSHVYGLESAALATQDPATGTRVMWAAVYEDPATRGNVWIYIDDGSGTTDGDPVSVVGKTILTAEGGEVDIYLPNKPIQESATFALYRNTGGGPTLVPSTDYYLNPAAGHIKLSSTAFPTGLGAGDIITATYSYYTGLVAEVQKVIDGDPADRSTYPGYRAAGILVRVVPPQVVAQTITANVTVLSGYNQVTTIATVKAEILAYVNGLGIGADVVRNELIERIMAVTGVYDVNLTVPSGNVVILPSQIARTTSVLTTVS